MASSKGRAARQEKERHKGESPFAKLRGPNTGAWENWYGGMKPGYYLKFHPEWNNKYDGPGKGTW